MKKSSIGLTRERGGVPALRIHVNSAAANHDNIELCMYTTYSVLPQPHITGSASIQLNIPEGTLLIGASKAGVWKIAFFDQYFALYWKWYKTGPQLLMRVGNRTPTSPSFRTIPSCSSDPNNLDFKVTIYIIHTLLSIPGKVFAHILLARIQPLFDATRRPQQSGFVAGRSVYIFIRQKGSSNKWKKHQTHNKNKQTKEKKKLRSNRAG